MKERNIRHEEFESLCERLEIDFKDDKFNSAHLDSGNLFAFFGEVTDEHTARLGYGGDLAKWISDKEAINIILNLLKEFHKSEKDIISKITKIRDKII